MCTSPRSLASWATCWTASTGPSWPTARCCQTPQQLCLPVCGDRTRQAPCAACRRGRARRTRCPARSRRRWGSCRAPSCTSSTASRPTRGRATPSSCPCCSCTWRSCRCCPSGKTGGVPRQAGSVWAAHCLQHSARLACQSLSQHREGRSTHALPDSPTCLQDLLRPQQTDLALRESAAGVVFVEGACEEPVACASDCLELLQLGERNRSPTDYRQQNTALLPATLEPAYLPAVLRRSASRLAAVIARQCCLARDATLSADAATGPAQGGGQHSHERRLQPQPHGCAAHGCQEAARKAPRRRAGWRRPPRHGPRGQAVHGGPGWQRAPQAQPVLRCPPASPCVCRTLLSWQGKLPSGLCFVRLDQWGAHGTAPNPSAPWAVLPPAVLMTLCDVRSRRARHPCPAEWSGIVIQGLPCAG